MSPKRALVTGCNGFVGGYLSDELARRGYQVWGCDLQDVGIHSGINYRKVDLCDSYEAQGLFNESAPNEIFHLAAVANPRQGKENPLLAYRANLLGTISVLEGCRIDLSRSVLLVGSSEQYRKDGGLDLFLDESAPVESNTVYGSSKIAAELIATAYQAQYSTRVFCTRSFNHTGPGQAPVYVLSDFARQCAEISLGLRNPELLTGNIDLRVDFLDVRDVVRAYCDIVEKGKPGRAYNVASGTAISLRECIGYMVTHLGLDRVKISSDPARIRAGEPSSVRGNSSLLRDDTSWLPVIPLERTITDLVDHWIEVLGKGRRG